MKLNNEQQTDLEELSRTYITSRGVIDRLNTNPHTERIIKYCWDIHPRIVSERQGHLDSQIMDGLYSFTRVSDDAERQIQQQQIPTEDISYHFVEIEQWAVESRDPASSQRSYNKIREAFRELSKLESEGMMVYQAINIAFLYHRTIGLIQIAEDMQEDHPEAKAVIQNLKKTLPKFRQFGINTRTALAERGLEDQICITRFSISTLTLDRMQYLPDDFYEAAIAAPAHEETAEPAYRRCINYLADRIGVGINRRLLEKLRELHPEDLETELEQIEQKRNDEMLKQKVRQHIKPDEDAVSNWYRDLRRVAKSFGYDFVCSMLDTLEPRPRHNGYTAAIAVEEIVFSYRASTRKKSPDELLSLVTTFRQKHPRMDLLQLRKRIQSYLIGYGTNLSYG